jgi:hypothetical protein
MTSVVNDLIASTHNPGLLSRGKEAIVVVAAKTRMGDYDKSSA